VLLNKVDKVSDLGLELVRLLEVLLGVGVGGLAAGVGVAERHVALEREAVRSSFGCCSCGGKRLLKSVTCCERGGPECRRVGDCSQAVAAKSEDWLHGGIVGGEGDAENLQK